MTRSARITLFVCLFALFPASSIFAQLSTIIGVVRDSETGEELIGATVLIVGTSQGASTDIEGRYTIRQVAVGSYDIRFSFVGYTAQTVTGIEVKEGSPARVDIALKPTTVQAQEVIVTARAHQATESAALAARKKAATIGDAITIEQVKRTPDATAAEALRRVTGVSIVDNKFVYVRGVTDRYNSTTINGVAVTMTDTETDKKSFAFDMVPSNLVENTTVVKTATPDLPGDFTGGLVQMQTLDFPDELVVKANIANGYSPFSNLKSFTRSLGSSTDWRGMDDGSRGEPARSLDVYAMGQQANNNWAQRSTRVPMNLSAGVSAGVSFDVGDFELGLISALSYRNSYSRNQIDGTFYRSGTLILDLHGVKDTYNVLWGGLLDFSVKSGPHKISFKNSFTRTGEDKAGDLNSIDENFTTRRTQTTEWNQRGLYVGQVAGEHRIGFLGDMDIKWRTSYTESHAQQPDRKVTRFALDYGYFEPAIRSWSYRDEFGRSASLDFSHPFDFGIPELNGAKLKYGLFADGKERYFDIRVYIVEPANRRPFYTSLTYPLDSAYAQQFFGPNMLQMSVDRDALSRDVYTGFQTVYAWYAMLDVPFNVLGEQFRFTGGYRMENSEQRVITADPFQTTNANAPRYTARVRNIDYLPSFNLTYAVLPIMNLRFAYSHSVNRPEFRELAAFYFYDYTIFEGNFGNPFLKRALSKNSDVRLEVFPDVGEVVAVSYFTKSLTDAIEQKLLISSNPERTWYNSPKGTNSGWELEVRKSFGFIHPYLQNLSFTANYSRINSEIEYTVLEKLNIPPTYPDTSYTRTREMQGQSPYTLNLSVSFTEPTIGTTVSFLYNEFGARLDAVADERTDDIYEDARGTADASLIQPLGFGLELKFTWKNMTDQSRTFTTRNGTPYRSVRMGTSYSAQLSFTL